MKARIIPAWLTFLCAVVSVSATVPIVRVADGQWKGTRYAVYAYPEDSVHLEAGTIDAEKEIPLRPNDAIKRASVALKTIAGDAHPRFSCGEVLLRRVDEGLGDWFYVVRFFSNHKEDWTHEGGRILPASLPFIVHLDGHVRPPSK